MDELERQCAAMMATMGAEHGMADGGSGMIGMSGMTGMGGMMWLGLLWIVVAAAVIGLLVAGAIWLVQRRQAASAPTPEDGRQTSTAVTPPASSIATRTSRCARISMPRAEPLRYVAGIGLPEGIPDAQTAR